MDKLTNFIGNPPRKVQGFRNISFHILDYSRFVFLPPHEIELPTYSSYSKTIGSLIGTVVDNFASKIPNKNAYIIPLGMIHIVPGILAIGLFFVPESPRWLATNGQFEKAERSLRWLRPKEWSVTEELEEMRAALAAEQQLQSKVGYVELFRNPIDRRRTTIAVLALTTQAASGAMFVIG